MCCVTNVWFNFNEISQTGIWARNLRRGRYQSLVLIIYKLFMINTNFFKTDSSVRSLPRSQTVTHTRSLSNVKRTCFVIPEVRGFSSLTQRATRVKFEQILFAGSVRVEWCCSPSLSVASSVSRGDDHNNESAEAPAPSHRLPTPHPTPFTSMGFINPGVDSN